MSKASQAPSSKAFEDSFPSSSQQVKLNYEWIGCIYGNYSSGEKEF